MKIVGHRELGSTSCPGKNFPLDYFKHYDQAGEVKKEDQGVEVDYYGKVTASALNCRTEPSTETGAIVSSYPNGVTVHISREKSGWGYTGDGWVSLDFVEKINQANTPKEESGTMDISKLSKAECYEIMQKAQEYAANLPCPGWATEKFQQATADGITDGTRPAALVTRCEAAIMAHRALKGGAQG